MLLYNMHVLMLTNRICVKWVYIFSIIYIFLNNKVLCTCMFYFTNVLNYSRIVSPQYYIILQLQSTVIAYLNVALILIYKLIFFLHSTNAVTSFSHYSSKVSRFSVLRSPFVYKTSQEQLVVKYYNQRIICDVGIKP
jgi:hypothetical protein